MSDEKAYHEVLADAMNEKGVSIEEVAHEFGVSSAVVKNRWLAGEMLPMNKQHILAWVEKGGMRRIRIRE